MPAASTNLPSHSPPLADCGPLALDAADRLWIEARAIEAGFHLAGLTAIAGRDSDEGVRDEHRVEQWLASGHHGDMAWIARRSEGGEVLRSHPQAALPWARSVLVCAMNYNARPEKSTDPAPSDTGWIARYAWTAMAPAAMDAVADGAADGQQRSGREQTSNSEAGSDYHDEVLARLRAVEAHLLARFGATLTTRCYVDTGPLVERTLAQRAGIGWIAKNTCILNQEQGSWLLLGVIVLSATLAPAAQPVAAADRCGTCTRCIDACPTDALIAPRQMDASRCIAYLTIEKKGSIDEGLRAPMGRQVFGCDICQDVCPWNRRAARPATTLPVRSVLINPSLEELAGLDSAAFRKLFRSSPLERTGRKRLLRNVAIAMGNSGERKFIPQLAAWSAGEDAVLAETAAWALTRLARLGA